MAAGFDILPGQNQDLSLDRTSVLVNGAGYAVLGAFFLAALPWWQPLAWIALCLSLIHI